MSVIFPHANNYIIDDDVFRAAWAMLVENYATSKEENDIPRLSSRISFAKLIKANHYLSLEYLCRLLVPNGYKNVAQATNPFMEANAHIVESTMAPVINPVTKRLVQGVRIIPKRNNLDRISPDIEALFESDSDELGLRNSTTINFLPLGPIDWKNYIDMFVDQVNNDPYQPMYRGKPIGNIVMGWDERLLAYFWPNPSIGLSETNARLNPIINKCRKLAEAIECNRPWSKGEEVDAVAVAYDIFKWGGVPQKPEAVIPTNVRNVFEAALVGSMTKSTPMNSGWTKVAAFATAHRDDGKCNSLVQVIWDSRVSTSVIRRLDSIFANERIGKLPTPYCDIGIVAGRGGTRINKKQLNFNWRNGYGRWDAQYIGSAFIREVCRVLNMRGMKMSRQDKSKDCWTVRGVEMVLFGDGY
jgi:hypothetical protein